MQEFFNPFRTTKDASGLDFLHGYQRVFRFGATLLTLTTLLTLVGLLVGPRRSRIGVLLLGLVACPCWRFRLLPSTTPVDIQCLSPL